ncbi:GNAT family N-acetyltransferase [Rhizobium ruizarguesonis]|jgi:ribosomal protein S18 acetylase RimI-like enzyme|uniref:GNAT family N-acetyltransferase n=1 Tax=Rhizobium ruizarguesonis TaxID=2081791 RepID=A0ABY1XH01_9HYPH|nr:GNAT family N-acetyltransferase [Rhizobium ruizarguesonis]MBY5851799.1 GNAT family N-acetyltransferase [Rhizobium leguminosarum]TCA85929.1 GNAT family N-acetyltransferase [Rhizobium leguminosarum bv. viciae]MBY5888416.1 GNAT family N-acetyltransferase [Rhizobium leguminosarum]NEH29085.1 GNAT family N-acetyltransferase [Rhizobium ruizarguesonis]NEH79250.1 GNAT family N-acetyltransferase [Rhizobium ruizarguesonis]
MYRFRLARQSDLAAIIRLLADDDLGASREIVSDPVDARYLSAFAAIEADANQLLAVASDAADLVVGCLQLSFVPGLSRTGMWRGQIESVRVASDLRGSGLGSEFIEWAIAQCAERGCGLVQLTSDKTRGDAIRFYERLGFVASHEGLKRNL